MLGFELPKGTDFFIYGVNTGVLALGIIALFAGLVDLEARQRQRLRWVAAGFGLYLVCFVYQDVAGYLPSEGWPASWSTAGWTSDVLNGSVIFIPLAVTYAVFKHYVLDINFIIGRWLVYGLLTSIAIAAFAIVE